MSEWYEPKDDDISLDKGREEVDIYVKQNDLGSVYVTLTFAQIKAISDEIENSECKHGVPLDHNCNACSDAGGNHGGRK